jgi:hypothetical protein
MSRTANQVTTNNESARRMMRAATKRMREEMAMATVTRVAVE